MFVFVQQFYRLFKHGGTVAGILCVVCVQLGFTAFITTSEMLKESEVLVLNANSNLRPFGLNQTNPVATIAPVEFATLTQEQDPPTNRQKSVGRPKTISYRNKSVNRAQTKAKAVKKRKGISRPLFSDTIIAVERPRPILRREVSETIIVERSPEDVPENTELRPRKRSLVASVIPIVKKPFGWVKTLGSKIF